MGFPENAWKPQIWPVKIAPKLEKSPDRNHKLISSEGGQDTVAYHISGHSLNGFSRKCPENPKFDPFH